jgi:hypothetical protein
MGKFFKRNLLLDLIHFLKILIYFADNDTKLSKISIKIHKEAAGAQMTVKTTIQQGYEQMVSSRNSKLKPKP